MAQATIRKTTGYSQPSWIGECTSECGYRTGMCAASEYAESHLRGHFDEDRWSDEPKHEDAVEIVHAPAECETCGEIDCAC